MRRSLAVVLFSLAMAVTTVAAPLDATAAGRSSRGYSLPHPSFSSHGYSAPHESSPSPYSGHSSNGYALPRSAPSGAARAPRSAGDEAMSRQSSYSALKSYAARREQSKFAEAGPPPTRPTGAFSSFAGRFPSYDAYYSARRRFYGGFGWQPPPYVYASRPSFGMWDAMFMWFLLDSLSNASHAAWFYNHENDPGYQQWRQEADRLAADNADLRAKLDALDQRERAMEGQPRDPSYMPADVQTDLALAPENAVASGIGSRSSPNWWLIVAVLAVGGCGAYEYLRRVRKPAF